jgi:hypothetical protein
VTENQIEVRKPSRDAAAREAAVASAGRAAGDAYKYPGTQRQRPPAMRCVLTEVPTEAFSKQASKDAVAGWSL